MDMLMLNYNDDIPEENDFVYMFVPFYRWLGKIHISPLIEVIR